MNSDRLFHVSETPDIEVFVPRPNDTVWAITAARLHNYLVPRDCPRVTFYARPETSAADRERFLGAASSVVAIESAWRARCESTPLYVYAFEPRQFRLRDEIAGYYTTEDSVRPLHVMRIDRPLVALAERGVDVRFLASLWHLREEVADSSLGFSIIRMRNASPPPDGFVSRFPVPGR